MATCTYEATPYGAVGIRHLLQKPHGGLLQDPGTGKTGEVLAAACILRKKKLVDRLLVFAPLNPVYEVWPAEIAKWGFPLTCQILHGSKKDARLAELADVNCINYDGMEWLARNFESVVRRGERWWAVFDECFHGSTLITTSAGHMCMKDVRAGDLVLSSDGSYYPVKRVYEKQSSFLVDVSLSDGAHIWCTANHPFFTDHGWVSAGNLQGRVVYDSKAVRTLLKEIQSGIEQAEILREVLRSEGVMGRPHHQESVVPVHAGAEVHAGMEQGHADGRQLAEETLEDFKGHGTHVPSPWWERAHRASAGSLGRSIVPAVGDGVCHHIGAKSAWLSNLLQGRLGPAVEALRPGGGRVVAQYVSGEGQGRQEDLCAGGTRVENISHHEFASPVAVYDLEVDGPAPHYYAAGKLVHNSTKVKHCNTKRFKLLRHMLPHFARRTILTGTPAPNGLIDLFGQVYAVDLGTTLGKYVTQYRREFFYPSGYGGYTWVPQADAEKRIYDRLGDRFYRVSDKVLGLKPMHPVPLYVRLPPKAQKIYDGLEEEFVAELKSGLVTAVNAGVLSSKLRQAANGTLYGEDEARLPNTSNSLPRAAIGKRSDRRVTHVVHDAKLDALGDLLEQLQGNPLLIGYEFTADGERIAERFGLPILNGSTPRAEKSKLFAKFNRGELAGLVVQTGAAAHGLNLQEVCHTVALYGLTWNLETYIQFNKRVHRKGQRRTVIVHHIVARGTIDETVWKTLREKDFRQLRLLNAIRKRYR